MTPPLREETRGPARIVVLARPAKRNALSAETATALAASVDAAGADEAVRGVVLAAEGPVFAAGGDLEEFRSLVDAGPAGADAVLDMGERIRAIERCPVPVVAAVAGDVFGGGCELLLLCDAVFLERGRRMQFRHVEMGLSPAWGASSRLVERVGPLAAARVLTLAEPIGADEAERIGLVTAAVDEGAALDRALAFVERAAALERAGVAAQKRLLYEVAAEMRGRAGQIEAALFRSLWAGPGHRRAMRAFAERAARRPSDGKPPSRRGRR